ncbi:tRNA(adenine(34)) deaminase, chloroplastic [Telopea speciosissima]|uniref:tRNA(adenine(34)) deaminase, chloroplastic n=1 Tax=Telopea speciosissima TaxID=54955 RepID=UPI001CC74AFB|nr:tRNA(adenine(34)) deaminase, chloroplastic [Telopea speciosissima]
MHNAYFSSAMALRSKGSLSFSFNDYRYLLNERIEKSSYPPCTCCALSIHRVPIYLRFLYGSRQSSLIHCSCSRRLILVGFDRYCRLPLCDLDRGCNGVSCSLEESSVCRRRRRRRDGRFGCMVWEEKSESCDSGIDGSAEAMLSLLTEELGEKFVVRSAARRDLVEKRGRVVDERFGKEKESVLAKSSERNSKGAYESITVRLREKFHQPTGSGRVVDESSRKEKECVQDKLLERNSKGVCESITVKSRGKFHQRSGSGRIVNERSRKEKEGVQDKSSERNSKGACESITVKSRGKFHQQSGSGRAVDERSRKEKEYVQDKSLERNSKGACESITVKSREKFHQQSGSGRSEASSRTKNDGLRREGSGCSSYYSVLSSSDIERDTDVQVKHAEFVGESSSGYSEKELRSSREDVLGVDVRKQFKSYDEDLGRYREISRQRNAAGSAVGSDTMRSGHEGSLRSKAENKITEISVGPLESRGEFSQKFSTKGEFKESGIEMVSSHEKQFRGREGDSTSFVNLVEGTAESNSQIGLMIHEHTDSRRKSQQVQNMSEIHAIDLQRASSSRKRFNGKEGDLTFAVNLVQETGEGNRKTVNETIETTDLRRKSRQLTKVSKDSNLERANTSQKGFETGMNIREEIPTSFQSSILESNDQQSQIYQGVNWNTKLRRESQDVTNMSEMTAGAAETAFTSQTLSETRVSGRERNSASILVDLVHEGRQDGSVSGERVIEQVGQRKESPRIVKASSFPRSTTKTPFHSIPQARVQHMGVTAENDRNSKIMLTPSPSQLVGVRTGYARIQASGEFSESSSSFLFTHPPTQNPAAPNEVNVETRTAETFGEHSRRESQDLTNMSEMTAGATETAFTSQTLSETRVSGRERNSASILVDLVHEGRHDGSVSGERVIERVGLRKQSPRIVKASSFPKSTTKTPFHSIPQARVQHMGVTAENDRNSKIMLTPSPSQLVGVRSGYARIQASGEFSESSSSFLFTHPPTQNPASANEVNVETRPAETFGEHSRRESQDLTNMSEMTAGATETAFTSQTLSETRVSGRERNSASILVDLVHEGRQDGSVSGERVIEQVGLRKESPRIVKASSFPRSTTKTPFHSIPQARVQHMGVTAENDRNSKIMLTPLPSQLVGVRTGYARIQASGEFSESSSSFLFTHPPTQNPASPNEVNVETRTDETIGEHSSLVLHDDALDAANNFERSSSQFVGEFVEKVQDEMLTSKIQKERSSDTMSVYKDVKYIQQGPSQHVSEGLQLKRPDSRRSSDVSGSKGPADEMWDVMDPSLHESSWREAPEEGTSTSGSAIVGRTGRSFWGIIADVARMRWGSENSNSALKSGRSSSNESFYGEARFSGHEPDENNYEDVKKRQRGILKEHISVGQPQPGEASTQIETEVSEEKISLNRISGIEADTSSYSGDIERGITRQGSSLASVEERSGWKEDGGSDLAIPSSIAPVDSSLPLPTRRFIRSPVIERIPESSKAEVSRSAVKEHMEQPTREKLTEVHSTDGKDAELKRRKLQRNKQVPKDRFDEWEKAYKLETEQRKVDIMFMREALLEAQRAADIWEVPVGAVLVRNGEIIARGCNLVEELRDSTAHAEMICIREASNLLQTWRLSDTTLYVTLEPCPMCAGAILQARIDTVVWGAPNKLLGADGSWVRLFPSGGDGGSRSDLTNQPAGPIHPFHPKITIRRRVLETECAEVMQQFFHLRRMKKEPKPEPKPEPPCLPVSTHPSKFFSKIHDMFSIMFCL